MHSSCSMLKWQPYRAAPGFEPNEYAFTLSEWNDEMYFCWGLWNWRGLHNIYIGAFSNGNPLFVDQSINWGWIIFVVEILGSCPPTHCINSAMLDMMTHASLYLHTYIIAHYYYFIRGLSCKNENSCATAFYLNRVTDIVFTECLPNQLARALRIFPIWTTI